eukprot:CFRG7400T1
MSAHDHYHYMRLAIEEAKKSIPVDSAYCVGCVITKGDGVIATGFSREIEGNTHAEQVALTKLEQNGISGEGCTLYTTMEPCSKRLSGNRDCTARCISAKVGTVVLGVKEPAHFVECEGVSLLEAEGIKVEYLSGLEIECLTPNKHVPSILKLMESFE